MSIRRSVDELASRPMTRKEFLASTGAVVLTLAGVTTVLKSFGLGDNSKRRSGYGASPYGGHKQAR